MDDVRPDKSASAAATAGSASDESGDGQASLGDFE
jgi:helicase